VRMIQGGGGAGFALEALAAVAVSASDAAAL
jgi:hypothetical protein